MSNFIGVNPAELLEKEMDRKDFLKHVAFVAVALLGISSFLKTLVDPHHTTKSSAGYGAYGYGGAPKR